MSTSLVEAQRAMSLYGLSTFLVFGTVGNILLICILVQRTHRQNSCSLYLLSATIVNLILIECILPAAVYSGKYIDPQNISLTWCKIRSYLFNALLMLYRWYKMAACVDRAAMCNHRAWIRSFSQARVACRVILGITIVWLIIPIHLGLFFRIENGHCVPESGLYAKLFSVYSIIISGWSPPIVMAIFGIISYQNLKKVRARIRSTNFGEQNMVVNVIAPGKQRIGNRDQQLIILLMCEVLLYISTNLLYSINITYSAITSNDQKTGERLRIESFISYFSTPFLIIINNCAPFYLYLCVSSKFRKDVKNLFRACFCCLRPNSLTAVDHRSKATAAMAINPAASISRQ
ncbi:unnamed protein product [Adineta ricciae]|uniref:G-protein coupled receptors family 1 profile domain-containing protein n=1 Tax=Adineta ricciae TaxID=249248 RepID=A0A814GU05_ADIRI|nr:unnamed protein product [Adineta ricciae]CAF1001275.1 unnamed protein product [Adineta ricciae]